MSLPPRPARTQLVALALGIVVLLAGAGCSIRRFAINKLGDALAGSGATYASDDDPELVRESLPFALKLIESLLAESPRHRGLLLAAASGFTQYTYAFLQQDADAMEDREVRAASALRARARRLYMRARGYALRGLDLSLPGFAEGLAGDPRLTAARAAAREVPFLYWAAASWGAAISLGKDDPEMLADLPIVEALLTRALALDESYDSGALHDLMISYEGGRADAMGGSIARAREHFNRALVLSDGRRAAPLVTFAEVVSVRTQDRGEFESLLKRALAIDPDAKPEWRLANLVMQRRAVWLLARAELLFAE